MTRLEGRAPRPRALALALAVAALLLAGLASAQPSDPPGNRRRTVSGWQVESIAEDDGGRVVRMTRSGAQYSLQYETWYWHGNARTYRRAAAMRGDCGQEGEEGLDRAADPTGGEVRAALASRLAWCETPRRVAETALRGFERAFALAGAWAAQAEAATRAEAAAIADHGAQPQADPAAPR